MELEKIEKAREAFETLSSYADEGVSTYQGWVKGGVDYKQATEEYETARDVLSSFLKDLEGEKSVSFEYKCCGREMNKTNAIEAQMITYCELLGKVCVHDKDKHIYIQFDTEEEANSYIQKHDNSRVLKMVNKEHAVLQTLKTLFRHIKVSIDTEGKYEYAIVFMRITKDNIVIIHETSDHNEIEELRNLQRFLNED